MQDIKYMRILLTRLNAELCVWLEHYTDVTMSFNTGLAFHLFTGLTAAAISSFIVPSDAVISVAAFIVAGAIFPDMDTAKTKVDTLFILVVVFAVSHWQFNAVDGYFFGYRESVYPVIIAIIVWTASIRGLVALGLVTHRGGTHTLSIVAIMYASLWFWSHEMANGLAIGMLVHYATDLVGSKDKMIFVRQLFISDLEQVAIIYLTCVAGWWAVAYTVNYFVPAMHYLVTVD